jgi:hypothetical protein
VGNYWWLGDGSRFIETIATVVVALVVIYRFITTRESLKQTGSGYEKLMADNEDLSAQLLALKSTSTAEPDPQIARLAPRRTIRRSLRLRAGVHKDRATRAQALILFVGWGVWMMFVGVVKDRSGAATELWETVSFRAGLVIFSFFVMQILVSAFRYSLRLAAFYDGRADALGLSQDGDLAALEATAKLFTPSDIDFGPATRTPIGEVAAVLQRASDSVKPDAKAKEKEDGHK